METEYQNIHQELIDRCRHGDRKSQSELYRLFYKGMYNVCLRMVGDPADAEDVMQEAFLNAFRKIDTYEGKVSFGAWLKRIVINRSLEDTGHFERFEAKLKAERRVISFNWTTVWKVAAAVVFVLMAVNQVNLWLAEDEKTPVSLAGISPEYAEIEFFYTSSIQSGIDSWNSMAASGVVSKADDQMMQQEFAEFERRYEEIRKEFEANPYDERVINALLDYYQAKLGVIEMIVSKLQEVKIQKNISHETEV